MLLKILLFPMIFVGGVVNAIPNLPQNLSLCDGLLRYSGTYNLEDPRAQLFGEVLGRKPLYPPYVIEFLAAHPLLKKWDVARAFDSSAGVSEGFSLREHTLMVFNVFREQERFFKLDLGRLIGLDFHKLFDFAIAFHDIGKPLGLIAFEKLNGHPAATHAEFKAASARQSEFTMPLLDDIMGVFSFSARERKVVRALVKDDLLGAVVTKRMSPQDAFEKMAGLAREADLDLKTYFSLKSLMYVADAASYPGLRHGKGLSEKPKPPVFVEQADGSLVPVSSAFHELVALIESSRPSAE